MKIKGGSAAEFWSVGFVVALIVLIAVTNGLVAAIIGGLP